MERIEADIGHFVHRTELVTLEEVIRAVDAGQQIIYYVGESLGIAKTKSQKVCNLADGVWRFAIYGKRGNLHLRKIEGREDGLNRYEYLVVPKSKS